MDLLLFLWWFSSWAQFSSLWTILFNLLLFSFLLALFSFFTVRAAIIIKLLILLLWIHARVWLWRCVFGMVMKFVNMTASVDFFWIICLTFSLGCYLLVIYLALGARCLPSLFNIFRLLLCVLYILTRLCWLFYLIFILSFSAQIATR